MELKRLEAKKCSCCGGNNFVDLDFNLTKCTNCNTIYFVNYTKEDLAYQEYLDKKRKEEEQIEKEERRVKKERARVIKEAAEEIKRYKKRTIISFILTIVFFILSVETEYPMKPGFIFCFLFFVFAFLINLVRTIKAYIYFPEM